MDTNKFLNALERALKEAQTMQLPGGGECITMTKEARDEIVRSIDEILGRG